MGGKLVNIGKPSIHMRGYSVPDDWAVQPIPQEPRTLWYDRAAGWLPDKPDRRCWKSQRSTNCPKNLKISRTNHWILRGPLEDGTAWSSPLLSTILTVIMIQTLSILEITRNRNPSPVGYGSNHFGVHQTIPTDTLCQRHIGQMVFGSNPPPTVVQKCYQNINHVLDWFTRIPFGGWIS